jgi:hypothetical protein
MISSIDFKTGLSTTVDDPTFDIAPPKSHMTFTDYGGS